MVRRNQMTNSNSNRNSNRNRQERPVRMRGPRTRTQGMGTQNLLRYSVFGTDLRTDPSTDAAFNSRYYIPGVVDAGTEASAGAAIAGLYSTGVWRQGTKACWVPTLGSNANGRIYMAYLDNPEQMSVYEGASAADRRSFIKSSGTMTSGSISQPLEFTIPTMTRRKRFDVNKAITNDINQLDRSCQGLFIYGCDGVPAETTVGSMLFHDILHVEGIVNVST